MKAIPAEDSLFFGVDSRWSSKLGTTLVTDRGNGIPKERNVDKRREVCEWEGECV